MTDYYDKVVTLEAFQPSSSQQFIQIHQIFNDANSRMNYFLDAEALSYQNEEMKVTILPVANTLLAKIGDEIAGFVSMLDNYIIGIYIATPYFDGQIEKKIIKRLKYLYSRLEVSLYLKNDSMLVLYLTEGFELLDYKTDMRSSERILELVSDHRNVDHVMKNSWRNFALNWLLNRCQGRGIELCLSETCRQ